MFARKARTALSKKRTATRAASNRDSQPYLEGYFNDDQTTHNYPADSQDAVEWQWGKDDRLAEKSS